MTLVITDIRWKRAILELAFVSDDADDTLFLYRVKERRFIPFEIEDDGAAGKVARLNLTVAQGRTALAAGEWIICRKIPREQLVDTPTLLAARPWLRARLERDVRRAHEDEFEALEHGDPARLAARTAELVDAEGAASVARHPYDTHEVRYAPAVTEDIERYSRLFRYGNRAYAYTVTVMAKASSEGALFLLLDVVFYRKNRTPEKRPFSLRYRQKQVLSLLYQVIRLFTRRTGNRVLFFKQNGEGPTENMAALRDRLLERGLGERFEVAERYRNTFTKRQSFADWIGDFCAIAKADYIFVDDYAPVFNFVELDDDVVLTQIWHAGVGFKSVGYARFGLPGSPDPLSSCHRAYTYALVGNAGLRDIYSEVFGIEREALLATGMPRLDHFLDEGVAEAAREKLLAAYPWAGQGRVLLFAPTFRGTGQKSAYYPYREFFDLERLYGLCERTNSYFVFEMHHFIEERPPIPVAFADRIHDLSDENLNELFHIADVLITDYSSCFYDFQLLRRPIVFYTPDRVVYSLAHGVQRPVKEMAPGVVCDDFDEFMDVLENESYAAVLPPADTLDRCVERSGLASDRAIDTILLGRVVPGVLLDGHS